MQKDLVNIQNYLYLMFKIYHNKMINYINHSLI